jgi:DNA-binding LacI/PurR family transcriptional regulator
MFMAPTINDIAKAAGVAKSTVSKVMNDSPTIPESTKQKIRDIMKEMNYIPNSIATQLAKQKCYNIGLLIDLSRKDHFLNHFFYNIIGGVESVIGPLNYELTICNIQTLGEDSVLNRFVLNRKVDGLIMDNSILTRETALELNARDFPYVLIGEWNDDVPVNWVDIDNRGGGEKLAQHLIDQGYRRIAFVGGEKEEPIFINRYNGVHAVIQQEGLSFNPEHLKNGYANEHNGYQMMLELLDLEEQPDSVVCMNNQIAFGVLQALRERKLRIPEDIGVATFDNYPLAPYTTPPLSCLNIDTFELGVVAGGKLMDLIAKNERSMDRWIQSKLVERESTAKA